MEQLFIVLFFIACACNSRSGITKRIMALKDSCDAIASQLDTLKKKNELRQNQLLHPSQKSGVDKLAEDAQAMTEKDRQKEFMQLEIQYLTVKDSLEGVRKNYLRQIDSLQLELRE